MSIPVEALTENDYLILEYINHFSSVHKADIEKHFKGKIDSLDYRLSVLAKIDYAPTGNTFSPIQNSNYIDEKFDPNSDGYYGPRKSLHVFQITDLGRATLQDHLAKKKSDKKDMHVKNIWIPIAVTLITNLIIDGAKWLFPLIQQWITNIQK